MEEKILEFIRVDDVPQGCKDLVEIFGMDTFISLVEYCGVGVMFIFLVRVLLLKRLEIGL